MKITHFVTQLSLFSVTYGIINPRFSLWVCIRNDAIRLNIRILNFR